MEAHTKEVIDVALTDGDLRCAILSFIQGRVPALAEGYPRTAFNFQVTEDGAVEGVTVTFTGNEKRTA